VTENPYPFQAYLFVCLLRRARASSDKPDGPLPQRMLIQGSAQQAVWMCSPGGCENSLEQRRKHSAGGVVGALRLGRLLEFHGGCGRVYVSTHSIATPTVSVAPVQQQISLLTPSRCQ